MTRAAGHGQLLSRDELFEILDSVKDPEVPVLSVVELGIVKDASHVCDRKLEQTLSTCRKEILTINLS